MANQNLMFFWNRICLVSQLHSVNGWNSLRKGNLEASTHSDFRAGAFVNCVLCSRGWAEHIDKAPHFVQFPLQVWWTDKKRKRIERMARKKNIWTLNIRCCSTPLNLFPFPLRLTPILLYHIFSRTAKTGIGGHLLATFLVFSVKLLT